jgi:chorismate mutase
MSFFDLHKKPFIIAGPCSAESRDQLWQTAEGLSGLPIRLFRAGVWKPRTRPGSFEGKGEEALVWLAEIKQHFGFALTVEVAEADHIEKALKYGVDCVWIGARTTVNPFQVQHIADALRGTGLSVMVKNPVNPDVDLWQGAVERIAAAGINDIAAVHRGFSLYKSDSGYRNQPHWIIPVELRRRMPGLPIFCDPSHITGKAANVPAVAQKAMHIGFDGLMIETHIDPAHALTDAAQQLTPAGLRELLNQLVIRKESFEAETEDLLQIEFLRQSADNIDAEIIELLAKRMELSAQLGAIKGRNHITAYQPERWREIMETRKAQGRKLDLNESYIEALWQIVHDESIRKQLEQLGGKAQ